MKLNNASRYAVIALAHLAAKAPGQLVPSHIIAEQGGMPEKFILKILKPLVSARVLESVKGPNGGYRLAQPPARITLLEVVETVDGPIRGDAPFVSQDGSALDAKLQAVCEKVAAETRADLRKVTLAVLIGTRKRGK